MFRLHDIESRDRGSKRINVIIDTPKGSRAKCKYDEALGLFRLSRVLPAGMQFPYDFGSVPRTRAEDGDALEVLVLMDAATFPAVSSRCGCWECFAQHRKTGARRPGTTGWLQSL